MLLERSTNLPIPLFHIVDRTSPNSHFKYLWWRSIVEAELLALVESTKAIVKIKEYLNYLKPVQIASDSNINL